MLAMNAICELRIRYVKSGYEPIPCFGKRPVLRAGQRRRSTSTVQLLGDAENKRKLFVKGKNNLAPRDIKTLAYYFGTREVGKDRKTGKVILAPHIIWHSQHVDVTATEAMQAASGQSGYAKREAREFLQERLEAGPQGQMTSGQRQSKTASRQEHRTAPRKT